MARRVLLVDDDPLIRAAGTRALERAGIQVVAVASAAEALKPAVGHSRFQTAILDYFLAGGECGCDLIEPLRVRDPAIRIVILSGLGALGELIHHAHEAGADLVASKTHLDWTELAQCDPAPPTKVRSTLDLAALRRELIHGAYLVHHRNVSVTARALRIQRSTLQRTLRRTPPPDEEDEADDE